MPEKSFQAFVGIRPGAGLWNRILESSRSRDGSSLAGPGRAQPCLLFRSLQDPSILSGSFLQERTRLLRLPPVRGRALPRPWQRSPPEQDGKHGSGQRGHVAHPKVRRFAHDPAFGDHERRWLRAAASMTLARCCSGSRSAPQARKLSQSMAGRFMDGARLQSSRDRRPVRGPWRAAPDDPGARPSQRPSPPQPASRGRTARRRARWTARISRAS